jgi:sugar/nucleoside kinase (ribokinase family)
MIITLGKQVAYVQNKHLEINIKPRVVQAMVTTAAGDTFSGALNVAITENID